MKASTWVGCLALALGVTLAADAAELTGRVVGAPGEPVAGAMVTLTRGASPAERRETTVFTDAAGRFAFPAVAARERVDLRVRRIGWQDLHARRPWPAGGRLELALARETDPMAVAEQLPADRWFALLHSRVSDPALRENLVRRCLHCHQQGTLLTRVPRDAAAWSAVLDRMEPLGAVLEPGLRAQLPGLLAAAYDPRTAVPALTAGMQGGGLAPPLPPGVQKAVIDEWPIGGSESMQHDIALHPDGRVYAVDMLQDVLYSIDPETEDGDRREYRIPHPEGFGIGGVVAGPGAPLPPGFNAYVAPHSLQVDSKGRLWLTLSYGNRLASFDPATQKWQDVPISDEARYPHTLRIDRRDRVWYTLMLSNHVGMLDIATGEQRFFAIPGSKEDSITYGIDVNPRDGSVWFSQLGADRIGRVDSATAAVEVIPTPEPGPRRLRFDSKGKLWIPAFSAGKILRYDPGARTFESFALPTRSPGTDAAYALAVDPRNDDVWISTTNTDTLVRLRPAEAPEKRFTVFPMPTRGTYTREIDFDARGRVYTSISNLPLTHVEGGLARIIRLDPRD